MYVRTFSPRFVPNFRRDRVAFGREPKDTHADISPRYFPLAPLSRRGYALTRKANIDVDKAFRSKGIKWESGNPISRRVAFAVRHNYIQLKAQQVTASTLEHAYIDRCIEVYSLEWRTSAKSN